MQQRARPDSIRWASARPRQDSTLCLQNDGRISSWIASFTAIVHHLLARLQSSWSAISHALAFLSPVLSITDFYRRSDVEVAGIAHLACAVRTHCTDVTANHAVFTSFFATQLCSQPRRQLTASSPCGEAGTSSPATKHSLPRYALTTNNHGSREVCLAICITLVTIMKQTARTCHVYPNLRGSQAYF